MISLSLRHSICFPYTPLFSFFKGIFWKKKKEKNFFYAPSFCFYHPVFHKNSLDISMFFKSISHHDDKGKVSGSFEFASRKIMWEKRESDLDIYCFSTNEFREVRNHMLLREFPNYSKLLIFCTVSLLKSSWVLVKPCQRCVHPNFSLDFYTIFNFPPSFLLPSRL